MMVDDVEPRPAMFQLKGGKEHTLYSYRTTTACSYLDSELVEVGIGNPHTSQLLVAATLAFNFHHPLFPSPDAMFNTILAGTFSVSLE